MLILGNRTPLFGLELRPSCAIAADRAVLGARRGVVKAGWGETDDVRDRGRTELTN